jgi:hypothetical protein
MDQDPSRSLRRLLTTLGVGLSVNAHAGVDFREQVAPVLEAKCLGCHSPNIAKGDVDLSSAASAAEFLKPGEPHASLLFQVSVPEAEGEQPDMPKKGDPLTPEEAESLRQWIEGGAGWPDGLVLKEASKTGKDWWAYQPLRRADDKTIDDFVTSTLKEAGLAMNGPADARTLIRRMTYDLIGLPPSPEEVAEFEAAFAKDPDGAVEQLADRLLASNHYGERWGRHWLDVVRFGESNGFERNFLIHSLWPFRDYVIKSINADKPFDRFIREHLAGDVFGRGDPQTEIGSAFLVAGPYDDVGNQDPVQAAQIRANTLDEIINATGEAFLGMTLGCARCHDHKFDPISQTDYYSLYATFAGVRHGQVPWATAAQKADRAARLKPLTNKKKATESALAKLQGAVVERAKSNLAEYEKGWTRPAVERTGTAETFAPVEAKFVRLVSEGLDTNPAASAGFRIDEFEVWSAEKKPRNVALASNGAKATGQARQIEDFPNAYGPQHAIDGKTGARFISTSTDLTIELARPTAINRVIFSSAKGETTSTHPKFAFVSEYRIEVSTDGETWKEVAHGRDRKPVGAYTTEGKKPTGRHLDHRIAKLEITEAEQAEKARLSRELGSINKEIAAIPPHPLAWIGTRNPKDAEGPFHAFIGGSPQRPGESVTPTSLSTLSDVAPTYRLLPSTNEATRRETLADWITAAENPLTWRVLANRIWHYHFGTGIVDSPNDFGYMGGRPSHPELLDHLATELQRNGYQLKPMHRLIVTSKAYRQSSEWRQEAADQDADARLLWRFPPRRLSAEEVRDTVLAIAGKLDPAMGGPGFRLYHFMQDNVCTYEPLDEHGPETYRRAVYHQNARASVVDLMTEFDQPDCAFSTPRRAETTTPLQALTLLNHSFTLDMAEALAARIEKEAGEDRTAQAKHLFQLAYQRPPSHVEHRKCVEVIRQHGLRAMARAVLNSSELLYCE